MGKSKLVLAISAEEYCKSVGKSLDNFVLEGVDIFSSDIGKDERNKPFEALLTQIENDVEVITNYNLVPLFKTDDTFSTGNYYVSGVALIPKGKN